MTGPVGDLFARSPGPRKSQRTALGEALVLHRWTRVRFPPSPPPHVWLMPCRNFPVGHEPFCGRARPVNIIPGRQTRITFAISAPRARRLSDHVRAGWGELGLRKISRSFFVILVREVDLNTGSINKNAVRGDPRRLFSVRSSTYVVITFWPCERPSRYLNLEHSLVARSVAWSRQRLAYAPTAALWRRSIGPELQQQIGITGSNGHDPVPEVNRPVAIGWPGSESSPTRL